MADSVYDAEVWRQIIEFPDYSISSHGRVRRDTVNSHPGGISYPGKILKQEEGTHGHRRIMLYRHDLIQRQLIHRLVARAFLPVPDEARKEVAHNDGNPRNNHVSNLRWATRRENAQDTIRHGTVLRGEKCRTTTFTADDVRRIRELRAAGTANKTLAHEYGVSRCTISAIYVRRNWAHVQ